MTSTIKLQATTIRNLQQRHGGINEQGDIDSGIDTRMGDKIEQRTEPQTTIVQ